MARRRYGRRRGRRRGLPKTMGGWVSLGFKVAGTVVALNPAIASIDLQNPQAIPRNLLFGYTGWDINNAGAGVNMGQLGTGVASILGGILLGKAGSIIGKRLG